MTKLMLVTLTFLVITAIATPTASVGKSGDAASAKHLSVREAFEQQEKAFDIPLPKSSDHGDAASAKHSSNKTKPKVSLIETSSSTRATRKGTYEDQDEYEYDDEPPPPAPSSNFLASKSSTPPDSPSGGDSKGLESLSAAMEALPSQSGPSTSQSRAMTTAAMEAAVMELMSGKSAFGATPMGGSVQKIVDILTKTMMPKVKDAHKADQDNLIKLNKELNKCFEVKNKALTSAAPWHKKYRKVSVDHKKMPRK